MRLFGVMVIAMSFLWCKAYCITDSCGHYFKLVQAAENEIVHGRYKNALRKYDEALAINGAAADYLNAGYCALYENDYDKALRYFTVYIKRGGGINRLSYERLREYFPTVNISFVKKLYAVKASADMDILSPYHSTVRRMMDSLQAVDQKYVRMRKDNLKKRPVKLLVDSMRPLGYIAPADAYDSFHYYNKLNYACVMGYIKQYGFPGESVIGCDSDNANMPACCILYSEFLNKGLITKSDLQYFQSAICAGRVSPSYYTDMLFGYEHKDIFASYAVGLVRSGDSLKYKDPELYAVCRDSIVIDTAVYQYEAELDSMRHACGLEPEHAYLNKLVFIIRNRYTLPFELNSGSYIKLIINDRKYYTQWVTDGGYVHLRSTLLPMKIVNEDVRR